MKNTAPMIQRPAHTKSRRGGWRMYSTANGTKTTSVIASWRILSWDSDSSVAPMRFAGIMNMYSNNAMLQLARTAMYHLRSLRFLRCPYHANVMKMFEITSRDAVLNRTMDRVVGVEGQALIQTLIAMMTRKTANAFWS